MCSRGSLVTGSLGSGGLSHESQGRELFWSVILLSSWRTAGGQAETADGREPASHALLTDRRGRACAGTALLPGAFRFTGGWRSGRAPQECYPGFYEKPYEWLAGANL